ncbi:MAG: hypothetical protein ACOYN6_11615 [Ignavibacteria bacterium]|nr:hypothetical protein [Ignavibacteriota bacterium]
MNNISKSQSEVWEWKESLYKETMNLPKNKRLEYLCDKSKDTIISILKNRKSFYKSSINTDSPVVADSSD